MSDRKEQFKNSIADLKNVFESVISCLEKSFNLAFDIEFDLVGLKLETEKFVAKNSVKVKEIKEKKVRAKKVKINQAVAFFDAEDITDTI
jgi:hypothetical protein